MIIGDAGRWMLKIHTILDDFPSDIACADLTKGYARIEFCDQKGTNLTADLITI